MDVNTRTLKSLEWERLKHYLAAECSAACSREMAYDLPLYEQRLLIEDALRQSEEGLRVFQDGIDISQVGLPDLRESLQRLSTGAALSARELLEIRTTLQLSRRLKTTLSNLESEDYPALKKLLLPRLAVHDDLIKKIDEVIDEDAGIRDDASPLLRKLRKEVQRQNSRIKDELQKIINSPTHSKCLQEPIYTVRNGRHVLPVLSNMRGSIEGIVHDSSSTGLTIYVEPMSVVELTNTMRINEAEIEHEIERLLWDLSASAAKLLDSITDSFNALVESDFIAAKAGLARKYEGSLPRLSEASEIRLLQARHPLLVLQSGSMEKVVPNDILLDGELSTLIITGPNTGGKTVYLKTAGLLSLMLRAGLLLPCQPGSVLSVFKVFADIGDEQSLEQNLSTFSSHMSNIIEITEQAGNKTLVLLDEIGAGTDPREGVILARVILAQLNQSGARTICSTHYGDLKTLAHSGSAYSNASMEFDERTLTPSYRLRLGVAGNSRAIQVAARLGLRRELISEAENLLESSKEDFEHKIDELESRLQAVLAQEDELQKLRESMAEREKELEKRTADLEAEYKRSRFQAANQFQDDYRAAKKLINELTANLQKTPSLSKAQSAKEQLESIKKELDWLDKDEFAAEQKRIAPGKTVRVRSLQQIGVLEALPEQEGEKAQVLVGRIKVKVALSDLELVETQPTGQGKGSKSKAKAGSYVQSKTASAPVSDPVFVRSTRNTLDLRGERVDEGMAKLERFIDESYLEHLSPLMVIHGHGTGAMKQAVRDYLRHCNYKNKSRPGENYEGGDGVTVINFS